MKKFDLSIYKNPVPYFYLYDVYIKENNLVKESFLIKIGVTPGSYRKCRKGELNIGENVIEQLSRYFDFRVPSDAMIDEIEKFLNKVYYNMYYKIYDSYDDDLKYINELINSNYVCFPIIDLINLYLKISSNKNVALIHEENEILFEKIKKYEVFLKYSLTDLYEIILLSLEKDIPENYWIKNYNNASAYFILSTRSYLKKRYIESLFFGNKCQEILFRDGNINRLIYLNYTLMSCLAHVGNYEECYELASRQLLSLKSIGVTNDFRVNGCRNYVAISLVGKRAYKLVYEEYNNRNDLTFIEEIAFIICLFIWCSKLKNFDEYEKHFNSLQIQNLKEVQSSVLILLDNYLKNRTKTSIVSLEKYNSMEHYINILKNIVFN